MDLREGVTCTCLVPGDSCVKSSNKTFSGAIHSVSGRLTNSPKPRLSSDLSRPGTGTSWFLAPHSGSSGELPVAKGHSAQPADPGVSCTPQDGL